MIDGMDGLVDKERCEEEMYEAESYTSSEDFDWGGICPSLRSYDSLEDLYCADLDEEDCRLVKLNNTIKQLVEVINDPIRQKNTLPICCLLHKILKYNGPHGFYLKYLPQIGEILEFLSMRAQSVPRYLDFLYCLLELCPKPPLLLRHSEILNCCTDLKRYFSLLSYLLVLAPTEQAFLLVKAAIEGLIGEEEVTRSDAVKPDVRREAVEASRLPITLAELAEVASCETYPHVLHMLLTVADVSPYCCFRIIETGVQNEILLRMHPEYTSDFKSQPITEDTDLHLDKEGYHEPVECASKILWRLLTAIIFSAEVPVSVQCIAAPIPAAMWSLRAAFRREVLRAGRSARSRKLRNLLAHLLLACLMCKASGHQWELVESGIASDLATLVVVTEHGIIDSWARTATLETDVETGLTFKETLLLTVALLADVQPRSVDVLKNKCVMSALLQLVNPDTEGSGRKMAWNSAQLWHLFKYASYALTYLAPKIPEEFIENNGSMRLLAIMERFLSDDFDATLIASLVETICSLATSNCDPIIDDFRKYEFVPVLQKWVDRVLGLEALSSIYQKIIASLLVIAENILANQGVLQTMYSDRIVKMAVKLLERCLHEKHEDSAHEQSFLIAIGSFIWTSIVSCSQALNNFLAEGGLYTILDIVERSNLPIQNLYLGVLTDICENTFCVHYLFTWRGADKKKGVMPLLIRIWREEERCFGVERTADGCIENVNFPLLNDDRWLYLVFAESSRHSRNMNTAAIGAARPKIYRLRELIIRDTDKYEKNHYDTLIERLSTEDQITMVTIDAYSDLKVDEAMFELSELLDSKKLATARAPLQPMSQKLSCWGTRVRTVQGNLLEQRRREEILAERDEFQRMRASKLNPAFDALEKLGFIGRTSIRSYLLAKCREQRARADSEIERRSLVGPLYRTYNFDVNVTAIFNQKLKIESTRSRKEAAKDRVSPSPPKLTVASPNKSPCSSASYKSDRSFMCKKYRFDPNEHYALT